MVPRIETIDWARAREQLERQGHAVLSALITRVQCTELRALFGQDERFRRHIVMQNQGYGQGEYKYFAYPLPELVQALREQLYAHLAPIANEWNERLGVSRRFPGSLEAYLAECHAAGQQRSTPLLLSYREGDFNRLHQDLYGEHVFPLQVAVLLSDPTRHFSGGEVVLTEQRARMQAQPRVVPLGLGDAVVFPVYERPAEGASRTVRLKVRHGVSELRSGERSTLGLIFHDAE